MKGCVQYNPFAVEKISPGAGLGLGTARSAGKRLTQRATGAPRRYKRLTVHSYMYKNDLPASMYLKLANSSTGEEQTPSGHKT